MTPLEELDVWIDADTCDHNVTIETSLHNTETDPAKRKRWYVCLTDSSGSGFKDYEASAMTLQEAIQNALAQGKEAADRAFAEELNATNIL